MFFTVVIFIAYALTYFIVSQFKMRKLRSQIIDLKQKNAYLSHPSKRKTPHGHGMTV